MDINGITSQLKGGAAKSEAPARPSVEQGQNTAQQSTPADVSLSLSRVSEILNKEAPEVPDWGTEFKTIPPIPHTVSELQESLNTFIDAVRTRINEIFDEAGIELEHDVQIQADAQHGVFISSADSQLDAITNTLNSDTQLGQQLNSLEQRHQLTGLLGAASELAKTDDVVENETRFQVRREQQEPLTLVIAANDET